MKYEHDLLRSFMPISTYCTSSEAAWTLEQKLARLKTLFFFLRPVAISVTLRRQCVEISSL